MRLIWKGPDMRMGRSVFVVWLLLVLAVSLPSLSTHEAEAREITYGSEVSILTQEVFLIYEGLVEIPLTETIQIVVEGGSGYKPMAARSHTLLEGVISLSFPTGGIQPYFGVGLGLHSWTWHHYGFHQDTELFVDVLGGIEFILPQFSVFAQVKGLYGKAIRMMIGFGIIFRGGWPFCP